MKICGLTKVVGAFAVAGLVALLSGAAAQAVMTPHPLTENVYKVQGVVAAAAPAEAPATAAAEAPAAETPAAEEAPVAAAPALPPLAPLLASADATKGQALTKICATCHNFDKGGPNKIGPNLWGIAGSPRAHLGAGFAYSAAMKAAGGKWTDDNLNAYLANPKAAVPGNKMAYAGIKNDQDRANVIAYLHTLKD